MNKANCDTCREVLVRRMAALEARAHKDADSMGLEALNHQADQLLRIVLENLTDYIKTLDIARHERLYGSDLIDIWNTYIEVTNHFAEKIRLNKPVSVAEFLNAIDVYSSDFEQFIDPLRKIYEKIEWLKEHILMVSQTIVQSSVEQDALRRDCQGPCKLGNCTSPSALNTTHIWL